MHIVRPAKGFKKDAFRVSTSILAPDFLGLSDHLLDLVFSEHIMVCHILFILPYRQRWVGRRGKGTGLRRGQAIAGKVD